MSDDANSATPNPPPVDRLTQLWRRVNEHKLVQWTVAYVAVAYAVQHAVELTGEAFEWPPAVLRVSMLLMVLGLPVVLTLAWYHGERASRHFSTAELTIVSLLLVIGSVVFYAFVQPAAEIASDKAPPVQQTGVEQARAAAGSLAGAISVAVLPFENLSGDPEQEFFSAGMTEEITSALAKIPDLRVVARTSAFQFKDQKRDIQAIAQTLRATHFVEGSVRKAGTRLRITAQLINATDGVSIWSESYDREFVDVFAIQEDIATAIAGAFKMPIGLRPGERLVNNRTDDLKAYEDYLLVRAIGPLARTVPNAPEILEQAVDPELSKMCGVTSVTFCPRPRRPREGRSSWTLVTRAVMASWDAWNIGACSGWRPKPISNRLWRWTPTTLKRCRLMASCSAMSDG